MPTNEGEVYFCLKGDDFDPMKVTEIIGLEPTRILRKGYPYRKNDPSRLAKFSYWHFSIEKVISETVDIYDMSSNLIKVLLPKTNEIKQAIDFYNLDAYLEVVLWISIDENLSTPAIGFDTETIFFLNNVNASIDIDTYKH